ncbi:FmdB family zinc ribbon protein [Tsukamurella hominis]|uniref:FmdB family zinc ribbon protein n=1 Tax=Tsukamurella hominis TaxID=1970232 RepID=UPI0039ECFAA2
MPTYSYQCKECGEAFDAVQSFSDDPLTVCPNCGGPLRKLFNSVGVVFKGSGFYRTDSRSSKADTTAKTEKKSDTAAKVDKATSS